MRNVNRKQDRSRTSQKKLGYARCERINMHYLVFIIEGLVAMVLKRNQYADQ